MQYHSWQGALQALPADSFSWQATQVRTVDGVMVELVRL
jgi:hypothetical protein